MKKVFIERDGKILMITEKGTKIVSREEYEQLKEKSNESDTEGIQR